MVLSAEGAFRRRSEARDRIRRPRVRLVIARPGRLGSPSAPTTWGCLQWLDADRMNAGESRRDQGGLMPPVRARKHGPEVKSRRQRCAARRRVLRDWTRAGRRTESVAPRGAPLPRFVRPRAFSKLGRSFASRGLAARAGGFALPPPYQCFISLCMILIRYCR